MVQLGPTCQEKKPDTDFPARKWDSSGVTLGNSLPLGASTSPPADPEPSAQAPSSYSATPRKAGGSMVISKLPPGSEIKPWGHFTVNIPFLSDGQEGDA